MKEIKMVNGDVVKFDDEKFDLISQYSWHASKVKGLTYAYAWTPMVNGVRKKISMHRLVMGLVDIKGTLIDHADGNGLNNQMSNLRVASHAENMRNRGAQKNNKCGLKGVRKHRRKWSARIRLNKKEYHLGTFDTPEAAAHAYTLASQKLHGSFARN